VARRELAVPLPVSLVTGMRLISVLFGLMLAACVRVTAGVVGDDVSGSDVQRAIDANIGPFLAGRIPNLKISPSRCPSRLDVSDGKVAHCVLPVDGVDLPIRVVYKGPDPQGLNVNLDGSFFETAAIDSFVERQLHASYGIAVKAHCPGPVVQVLQPGTLFSCAITGSPLVKTVRLKALSRGMLFQYNVPGLRSGESDPDNALTKHKRGEPVILKGSELEAYLSRSYLPLSPMATRLAISCPEITDLSGRNHVICQLHVRGMNVSQRIDVSITEPNGFHELPLDAIIDKQRVQRLAQNDLNSRLQQNGDAADATVDCGTGIIAAPAPGQFTCKATAGGKSYDLIVTVEDFKGTVHWHGVEVTPTPSASPR